MRSFAELVSRTMQAPEDLFDLTVPQLLRLRARENPHRLALSARSVTGARDRLTYAQLVHRMEAMARGFARLGLGRGERIAVLLTNDAGRECILTALGAFALGCAVAPLNTRASDEELAHALELVEPSFLVTTAASVKRVAGIRHDIRVMALEEGGVGAVIWPEPVEEPPGAQPAEPTDPDELASLLFTSGTTARSKAVMHTHRTMIATGACCAAALGITRGDLYQGAFPFFTSSALNLACMSSWVGQAGFIYEELLDNAGRLRLIASERTTFYHGVPSVLNFMLQEFERGAYDLRSLRRVAYGGAAMPPEVADRIAAAWPWIDQVQIYGLTESGPTGSVLAPEERALKPGSVGRAMPYCALRIVDEEGEPQPVGAQGEIVIEGPGIGIGYYRNPAATKEAFEGRAVRTGDVGYLDAQGFLFFGDRKKDVINRGGLKISSVAVESVLYRHPSVREAAVVPTPHPGLGEDVAAFVVPYPGQDIDVEALAEFCRDKLADYERPRHWHVVEELPKNPMGKILKVELRRRLAEAHKPR